MPCSSTFEPVNRFCISDSTIVKNTSLFRLSFEIVATLLRKNPARSSLLSRTIWRARLINFSFRRSSSNLLLTAIFIFQLICVFQNKILRFGAARKKRDRRRQNMISRQNNIARCLFHALMRETRLYKLAALDC